MSTKKASGAAIMRKRKRSLIWATFTDEEKKIIRKAAAEEMIPMSQLVTKLSLEGAKKILEKSGNNH